MVLSYGITFENQGHCKLQWDQFESGEIINCRIFNYFSNFKSYKVHENKDAKTMNFIYYPFLE